MRLKWIFYSALIFLCVQLVSLTDIQLTYSVGNVRLWVVQKTWMPAKNATYTVSVRESQTVVRCTQNFYKFINGFEFDIVRFEAAAVTIVHDNMRGSTLTNTSCWKFPPMHALKTTYTSTCIHLIYWSTAVEFRLVLIAKDAGVLTLNSSSFNKPYRCFISLPTLHAKRKLSSQATFVTQHRTLHDLFQVFTCVCCFFVPVLLTHTNVSFLFSIHMACFN